MMRVMFAPVPGNLKSTTSILAAIVLVAGASSSPALSQILVGSGLIDDEANHVVIRPPARKQADLKLPPKEELERAQLQVGENLEIPAAPDVDFWLGLERIIPSGQKGWRFFDSAEGPPKDWLKPEFDDSKWQQGQAPLGYGEGIVVSELKWGDDEENKIPSASFRLKFDAEKPDTGEIWAMRAMVDDGAMFYLNGKEIQRVRMPEGEIKMDTRPNVKTGSSSGLERKWVNFTIDPKAIRKGNNVLCASVHQFDADSSDLLLDVELIRLKHKRFLAISEKLEARKKAEEEAKRIAEAAKPEVPIRIVQPASLLRTFDSRLKPELSRVKQMLRSLPRVIGINENQVEELILAADDSFERLRKDVETRSENADQRAQSLLRNEIYQNKLSILKEQVLIETFAAILTPKQLQDYSNFAKHREDQRLTKTVEMFYANLDCSLFMTEEQRPKMIALLKEIALDPANQRTYYSNNPINEYYRVQNGFNTLMRSNNLSKLEEILDKEQMAALVAGSKTGNIYGNGFIEVEQVLIPQEK